MEAVAKALKDFPGMNISVDGDYIIKRKYQPRNGGFVTGMLLKMQINFGRKWQKQLTLGGRAKAN
jgi:hypothetical protein